MLRHVEQEAGGGGTTPVLVSSDITPMQLNLLLMTVWEA